MPAMVAEATWKALKPNIGRVIRLIKRWSCSRILLRHFACRTLIVRPPGIRGGVLSDLSPRGNERRELYEPAVQRRVVNDDAPLFHDLLKIAI